MKHINLKNNTLVITFPYDQECIDAVRSIPGRVYSASRKHWRVPAQYARVACAILQPLGFTPTLDVKRLIDMQVIQDQRIAQARDTGVGSYDASLPLYNFQKKGAAFIAESPGSLLADVPGLGKTIQTISALHARMRILVFCPASLKYNWEEEIAKFKPNDSAVVIDGNKMQRQSYWSLRKKWTIANYELLLHDFQEISAIPWDAIVCDEATRISNPMTKTARALMQLHATKRVALTGTPVSNSPIDIFGILNWITPDVLGNYYHFLNTYCVREPIWRRIVGFKDLDKLSSIVSPYILRRTKDQVFDDFPKKTSETILFDLSEDEKKLYSAVRKQIVDELKDLTVDQSTLNLITVKMLRLKQCTDHPKLISTLLDSSKLNLLLELLNPIIQSREKVLIFTQFAQMAKILERKLKDHMRVAMLIGEMDSTSRQNAIHAFQDDEIDAFISTEAGSYGLNLQNASYVFHYDLPWSIAKMEQREGRADRIGQTKPVTVYTLAARNTIDEYVAKVLRRKQNVSDEILTNIDQIRAEDIQEILTS